MAKRGEQAKLRIDLRAAGHLAAAVKDDVERPPGHQRGVELLERPGGGVAWVGEQRFTLGLARLVHFFKTGPRHDDLAACLEHVRHLPLAKRLAKGLESERDASDCA